jgi:sodium transport system permease protein
MNYKGLILKIIGIDRPLPYPRFVILTTILVGLLQVPAGALMFQVDLGIGVMVNEVAVILGLPLLLSYALRFDTKALFPFISPRLKKWAPGIIITLGAAIIIDYLTALNDLFIPPSERYQQMMDQIMTVSSGGEFAYKLFLLCLVPAFCEEIFFRGFCQNIFARYKGNVFAILLTGALFAILHGNPWHIHLYFLLGCFLSWIYMMTRTLWIPILCHFLNNAWVLTNHAADTTPPWEGSSIALNAAIVICGISLFIVGAMVLIKSKVSAPIR